MKSIKKVSSNRITSADIENAMCELSRESPPTNCRKKDVIFWDISRKRIQNFFRIHKTNQSMLNSIRKYKVQFLYKLKWKQIDTEFNPIFTPYNDILYDKSEKEHQLAFVIDAGFQDKKLLQQHPFLTLT